MYGRQVTGEGGVTVVTVTVTRAVSIHCPSPAPHSIALHPPMLNTAPPPWLQPTPAVPMATRRL